MEFTSTSLEGMKAEASAKGMYVVDPNSKDGLLEEYDDKLEEADKLIAVVDPDTTPYLSKYKARELLDAVVNKCEATKTIAMMEARREDVAEMAWRIAAVQTKLGVISWEVEEPHNAQIDLERGAAFYAPGFVAEVDAISDAEEAKKTNKEGGGGEDGDSNSRVTELPAEDDVAAAAASSAEPPVWSKTSPEVKLPKDTLVLCMDAMKCLNMLGILWAGRGVVHKSFLYLLAANKLYARGKVHLDKLNATSSAGDRRRAKEMESVYTHNLFYLAQAYGHIGDTRKSGEFCFETLQRQYAVGFDNMAGALDWIKNCVGISDFYIALGHYKKCSLALLSAQAVYIRRVLTFQAQEKAEKEKKDKNRAKDADPQNLKFLDVLTDPGISSNAAFDDNDIAEVEADLSRRLAHLDQTILKHAYERKLQQETAVENGVPFEDAEDDPEDDDAGASSRATKRAAEGEADCAPENIHFFKGLPVSPVPFLTAGAINTFADARVVFLRAGMHIDVAKKHFVLDGFVSDHAALLQAQSKLYHFLAAFETESKRKLAMENKRIEILSPLLKTLNRVAFEGLHKQVSYELGEAYMTLQEIKIEKIRSRRPDGVVNSRVMKPAEMQNCNAYAHGALAMFSHYASFFAAEKDATGRGAVNFADYSMDKLATAATTDPNAATISEDEVRSFLNAHFLCCRMMSKVLVPHTASGMEQSKYMVHCLKRYEWLVKYGPALCGIKKMRIEDVFGDEYQVCACVRAVCHVCSVSCILCHIHRTMHRITSDPCPLPPLRFARIWRSCCRAR